MKINMSYELYISGSGPLKERGFSVILQEQPLCADTTYDDALRIAKRIADTRGEKIGFWDRDKGAFHSRPIVIESKEVRS